MRRERRRPSTTEGRGGNCRMASQDSSVILSKESTVVIFSKESITDIFSKDSTRRGFGDEGIAAMVSP